MTTIVLSTILVNRIVLANAKELINHSSESVQTTSSYSSLYCDTFFECFFKLKFYYIFSLVFILADHLQCPHNHYFVIQLL